MRGGGGDVPTCRLPGRRAPFTSDHHSTASIFPLDAGLITQANLHNVAAGCALRDLLCASLRTSDYTQGVNICEINRLTFSSPEPLGRSLWSVSIQSVISKLIRSLFLIYIFFHLHHIKSSSSPKRRELRQKFAICSG